MAAVVSFFDAAFTERRSADLGGRPTIAPATDPKIRNWPQKRSNRPHRTLNSRKAADRSGFKS